MTTDCSPHQLEFQGLTRRMVVASFDGGTLSSDGGVLLLGEVDRRLGLLGQFAACFTDHRIPGLVEHSVVELVRQGVFGLALSYEDLNDHDELRTDPLLAAVVGKADPTGSDRHQEQDRGKPLAGKSTLNRLEWGAVKQDRYRKIIVDDEAVDRFFVDVFLSAHEQAPAEIVLDLDATDDALHGEQEGRFFHGYYGGYCYLPLHIFCGSHLLCSRLRRSDIDASSGSVAEVERIVAQIRERWPEVRIILRGDSGFAREELMAWGEQHAVDFVFGLARNARLQRALGGELAEARAQGPGDRGGWADDPWRGDRPGIRLAGGRRRGERDQVDQGWAAHPRAWNRRICGNPGMRPMPSIGPTRARRAAWERSAGSFR